MDIIKVVQGYVHRMTGEGSKKVSEMNVLLLDADTTSIISMATTQSSLLANQIYLIDRLDNHRREKLRHLKCICFIRPTSESIQNLIEEFRDPKYGDYSIYLSNVIRKSSLERLAEADDHEVVQSIMEFYADYLVINQDLFSFHFTSRRNRLYGDAPDTWDPDSLSSCTEGIIALLLSLKKKPLIRYEKNSPMAKKLSSEISFQVTQEGQLFDFRRTDTAPILLILDRKNDPITPLLSQWTYQAMVHELLGIENGRVDLSSVPDIRQDLKEVVLSTEQDTFYKTNIYMNFGDLGANIKNYVNQYQSKTKSNMDIESIADMKRFVEEYPEFRKLSGNVSKHVTLLGELSRIVDAQSLLEVSELEQSLACNDSHASDLKNYIQRPLDSSTKVRLVALYALRYEKQANNATPVLLDLLKTAGVPAHEVRAIEYLHANAGQSRRMEGLYASDSIFSRARSGFKGLKGVENVYTQHTPRLSSTLESLIRGRLSEALYPYLNNPPATREKPQDIIVFFVGGTTYAEAKLVAQFNASMPGVRIVLGSSIIHNSLSFLQEVEEAGDRWPQQQTITASQRLVNRLG